MSDRLQRLRQVAMMSEADLAKADIDELDELAFGYVQGVQEVPVADLHIKYDVDYENALDAVEEDPEGWVDALDEPVDVSLERGILYLEDGHHRYVTAQMLDLPTILADVTIKDNPVQEIQRLYQEATRSGWIMYRGSFYEPAPSEVFYRGDRYVVAQEPAEDAPKNPLAPDERTLTTEDKDKLKPRIDKALDITYARAQKVLDTYKIKGQLAEQYAEDDGVDLEYNIASPGTPNAKLTFDYALSWFHDIKFLLQGKMDAVLQEVSFDYCQAHFLAVDKEGMDGLLKAVGLLQAIHSVEGEGTYSNLPHINADENERVEWLLSHILGIIEDRPDIKVKWTDRAAVLEQLKTDRSKQRLDPAQFETAKAILTSKTFTQKSWEAAVDDMLKNIKRRKSFKPSRDQVAAIVREVTAHEAYSGGFSIVHDPTTNLMVVVLESPYAYRIVVDWHPGAGVKFREAHLVICERTYMARDLKTAKALLSAMVDLTMAHGTSANEDISRDRSDAKKEKVDVVEEIANRISRDMSKWMDEEARRLLEEGGTAEEQLTNVAALQRAISNDPNTVIDAAHRNPQGVFNFLTKVTPAMTVWLWANQEDITKQLADIFTQSGLTLPDKNTSFITMLRDAAHRKPKDLFEMLTKTKPELLAWLREKAADAAKDIENSLAQAGLELPANVPAPAEKANELRPNEILDAFINS